MRQLLQPRLVMNRQLSGCPSQEDEAVDSCDWETFAADQALQNIFSFIGCINCFAALQLSAGSARRLITANVLTARSHGVQVLTQEVLSNKYRSAPLHPLNSHVL